MGRRSFTIGAPMQIKLLARFGASVLAVASVTGLTLWASQGEIRQVKALASGRLALVLDGKPVGFLGSAVGGDPVASVVTERSGTSTLIKKRIGSLRFDEIELKATVPPESQILDWIAASLEGTKGKSGAIVSYDLAGKVVSSREFFGALISEIAFPAMDGTSKSPGFITLKLAPEGTRLSKTGPAMPASLSAKHKIWVPSNFRLEIPGVDTSRVSKIDAISIKQRVVEYRSGNERTTRLLAGAFDPSNLKVYVPEAFVATWDQWFDDFVIKGNNSDAKERSGAIVLLDASLKEPLMKLKLSNLGILSVKRPTLGSSDPFRRVEIELYCERIEIVPGGGPFSGGLTGSFLSFS